MSAVASFFFYIVWWKGLKLLQCNTPFCKLWFQEICIACWLGNCVRVGFCEIRFLCFSEWSLLYSEVDNLYRMLH